MKRYIDADLLRKEIEFAKSVYDNPNRVVHGVADAFRQDGRAAMCDDILKKIDSLQQEQPTIEEDWVEKRKQECMCRRLSANGNYQCERYEGVLGPCDGRCSWVIDYPKLKELEEMKQHEVDLEKEFDDFLEKENAYVDDNGVISYYNGGSFNHTCDIYPIARHFYELGRNARKEDL